MYSLHTTKNLISCFFGNTESPPSTRYYNKLRKDHDSVLESMDQSFSSISVRDCICLGKFKKDHDHPHPILVKFNSAKDTCAVLNKRTRLFSSEVYLNLFSLSVICLGKSAS